MARREGKDSLKDHFGEFNVEEPTEKEVGGRTFALPPVKFIYAYLAGAGIAGSDAGVGGI